MASKPSMGLEKESYAFHVDTVTADLRVEDFDGVVPPGRCCQPRSTEVRRASGAIPP